MIPVEKIIAYIRENVQSVDIEVDKGIIFGSTATGERTDKSDTDIILISDNFEDINIYKRPVPFLEEWDNIKYGPVEFICLTSYEFNEKKKIEDSVYDEANENGITIDFNSD